jgi:hypothetical protein
MRCPVKDALMYIQSQPLGGRQEFQGESFYTARTRLWRHLHLKEALPKRPAPEAERAAARAAVFLRARVSARKERVEARLSLDH